MGSHPSARIWLVVVVGSFLAVLFLTHPNDYVDTFNYARNIVEHDHGQLASDVDPYWDFGHAILRPLGNFGWKMFRVAGVSPLHRGELFDASIALIMFSIAGSLAVVIFIYLLSLDICGEPSTAALVALGFGVTDAVVNYAQTGTAYMFGIACHGCGLFLLCRSIRTQHLTVARAAAIAIPLALSICVWFPNVLPMAGILCFALLWNCSDAGPDWRRRIPFAAAIAVGIALVVGLCYSVVMINGHVTSFQAFQEWMTRSRYGIKTDMGLLRMVIGIPRGFFWLGEGSTTWKQAFFHAGGNRVSIIDLLRSGIWKIVVVYIVLLLAVWKLWGSTRGKMLLLSITAAALPVFYFAAFLFDPGPPERYLALFPLLFCGFAYLLSERRSAAIRVALPLFFFAMLTVNMRGMWRFGNEAELQPVISRLEAVDAVTAEKDRILVLGPTEAAFRFLENRPFHPASRNRFAFTPIFNWGKAGTIGWKRNVASLILETWQIRGRVWLTRQVLFPKPELAWNWVEGNDSRINWNDIPAFFNQLDLGDSLGGTEGFVEILPSVKDQDLLRLAAQPAS